MKLILASIVATVALTAVAPAWACIPPPVTDQWVEGQARSGPVAVGTVVRTSEIAEADCRRLVEGLQPFPPYLPVDDICRGRLGTADVRIEGRVAGEAAAKQTVNWGERLPCRAGFILNAGDRVAIFAVSEPVQSPLFGRLTARALPEDMARAAPRLAAAFDGLEAR